MDFNIIDFSVCKLDQHYSRIDKIQFLNVCNLRNILNFVDFHCDRMGYRMHLCDMLLGVFSYLIQSRNIICVSDNVTKSWRNIFISEI